MKPQRGFFSSVLPGTTRPEPAREPTRCESLVACARAPLFPAMLLAHAIAGRFLPRG